VGRYLKERNPEIKIIGADPEGSVLSGGAPRPWKVEGIGEDFVPKTFNGQVVDEWIRVSDIDSFNTARLLARREGLLLGGSSGTNVAAALRYARRLGPEHLIVALGCDTGRNYLSKFFDDNWLAENRLTFEEHPAYSIGDLIRTRGSRPLYTITPNATVADAIALMESTGISQLPVLDGGKSVGSIQEVTLARVLHDNCDPEAVPISEVMARPLPQLDVNVHLDEAYRLLLSGNTGVLVTNEGKVIDIITRIDLVHYWNRNRAGSNKLTAEAGAEQAPRD